VTNFGASCELACEERSGTQVLEVLSRRVAGRRAYYPSQSQMAKVEPRETVRKGYEQPSKRGFRRCGDAKMSRKVRFRWSIRLHRRLFRPFSDSLRRGILRSSDSRSCIDSPLRAAWMASADRHVAWVRSTFCGVGCLCKYLDGGNAARDGVATCSCLYWGVRSYLYANRLGFFVG
jgi:hypothetical protein